MHQENPSSLTRFRKTISIPSSGPFRLLFILTSCPIIATNHCTSAFFRLCPRTPSHNSIQPGHSASFQCTVRMILKFDPRVSAELRDPSFHRVFSPFKGILDASAPGACIPPEDFPQPSLLVCNLFPFLPVPPSVIPSQTLVNVADHAIFLKIKLAHEKYRCFVPEDQ